MARPGPVYDNALRHLAAEDLRAVCAWLGIEPAGATIRLSEALPATTQHVDLLVASGPGRLAHVEFVRRVEPDLALRMLEYRVRIMRLHPDTDVRQHVVVLGAGHVAGEFAFGGQLRFSVDVTHVRDRDPAEMLANASLAPLAPLGRARDPAQRARLLRASLAVITAHSGAQRLEGLATTAAALATIYLDAATIETAWKEAGMPISISGTDLAREFERRGEKRGEKRGEERGSRRARVELLVLLLRRRFGEDPRIEDLAARLAARPPADALAVIEAATSLDALS